MSSHSEKRMMGGGSRKLFKLTLKLNGEVLRSDFVYLSIAEGEGFTAFDSKGEERKDGEFNEQYDEKKRKFEEAPKQLQNLLPQLHLSAKVLNKNFEPAIMNREKEKDIPCRVKILKKLQHMKARKRRPLQAMRMSATRSLY